MTTTSTNGRPTSSAEPARRRPAEAAHRADLWTVRVPAVGTLALSTPELVYMGGVAGLSVLGLIEWPIGLVLVGGHLLTADRSSRDARELGAAMSLA